jgi:hypothetical protein
MQVILIGKWWSSTYHRQLLSNRINRRFESIRSTLKSGLISQLGYSMVVFFAPIKASREVSVAALVQPGLIKAIFT